MPILVAEAEGMGLARRGQTGVRYNEVERFQLFGRFVLMHKGEGVLPIISSGA